MGGFEGERAKKLKIGRSRLQLRGGVELSEGIGEPAAHSIGESKLDVELEPSSRLRFSYC